MQRYFVALIAFAAFALIFAGVGDYVDTEALHFGTILLNAFVLFAALVLFFLLLPQWFGLPIQILIAMGLGVLAGFLLGPEMLDRPALVTDYLGIFGALFILPLKMVIVPLVFVSVLLGVAGLGDIRRLGALGAKTIAYYLTTTCIAVFIGLTCVNIIQPGNGLGELAEQMQAEREAAEAMAAEGVEETLTLGERIQDRVLPTILQNPVMVTDPDTAPILAIITLAILLGAALTADIERSEPAIRVFQGLDRALITLVLWIMALAPIGAFALIADAVATLGIDYIIRLGAYVLTVLLGLSLHLVVLVAVILPLFARISPGRFIRGMAPAMQVAFSTSSSSATLPVTIECAIDRVGVNPAVARFMLPVGATINMDGTALYTAIATIFVAEVYGISMGIADQITIFLTAVVVSIGTAGIPGASIAMMTIIFTAVDLPVAGIGLVVGVDRILDMCRTTVNVTGDSVGAALIGRTEHPAAGIVTTAGAGESAQAALVTE